MAKLLMGSIVTKAVGRINGHCFRLNGSTQILQRNPLRGFQNAINTNKALPKIRNVMASWLSLGSTAWEGWRLIANDNPVSDRFGNPKTLTARAFYTKCAINCSLVSLGVPDYTYWLKDVPECYFDSCAIILSDTRIQLNGFVNVADTKASFRAVKLDNESQNPNPLKIPIVGIFDSSSFDPSDLWLDVVINNNYIFIANCWYLISVTVISASGVASVTKSYKVLVEA